MNHLQNARNAVRSIAQSGLTIYDPIEIGSELWIPAEALEVLLQTEMAGHRFEAVAIRTRTKLAKQHVCSLLGYPIPKSFARVKPRIPGQDLDVYVQSNNNFQVHNEKLSPSRRYVIIRPNQDGVIQRVRVVNGADLAPLDRTGKLTGKYQARASEPGVTRLASEKDTFNLAGALCAKPGPLKTKSPLDLPEQRSLWPINEIFQRLKLLVGQQYENPGVLQERSRGGLMHRLVAEALGYRNHADNGKFPDLRHQLLEIKFQTSPTIDLGIFPPDCEELLDIPTINSIHVAHRDVRYAVFYGRIENGTIAITGLTVVTGQDFFGVFKKFGGLVINQKIQLILPGDFFERNTEGIFD